MLDEICVKCLVLQAFLFGISIYGWFVIKAYARGEVADLLKKDKDKDKDKAQ